MSVTDSPDLLI